MNIPTINTDRLASITTLFHGAHSSFEKGACAMEAASYIADEPWSDHPKCVCPVIGAFMREWNDGLPSDTDRSRLLLPLIPKIIGTRATPEIEQRRATMAADWLIRVNTPAWLELAGLTSQANLLRQMPEITDFKNCPSLMPALTAIKSDAAAAWAAARDAARDAAGDKLQPAVDALQVSALELIECMAAVQS